MAMLCSQMDEGRSAFKTLTGKRKGKRLVGRCRGRCEENTVKIQFKEKGVTTRNWVDSAQDRDYWRAL